MEATTCITYDELIKTGDTFRYIDTVLMIAVVWDTQFAKYYAEKEYPPISKYNQRRSIVQKSIDGEYCYVYRRVWCDTVLNLLKQNIDMVPEDNRTFVGYFRF